MDETGNKQPGNPKPGNNEPASNARANPRYEEFGPATDADRRKHVLNRVVRLRVDDDELETELGERFVFYFAQFKSSSREAEYFIHLPLDVLSGRVSGITRGRGMPDNLEVERFQTVVVNHERTLAQHWIRTMGVIDKEKKEGGQVVIKDTEET